jgi:hypothetical protein
LEECGPCPVFASFTLAFALQLRKKHGKPSVRLKKNLSYVKKNRSYVKRNLSYDKINLSYVKKNLSYVKNTSVAIRKTSVAIRKTVVNRAMKIWVYKRGKF